MLVHWYIVSIIVNVLKSQHQLGYHWLPGNTEVLAYTHVPHETCAEVTPYKCLFDLDLKITHLFHENCRTRNNNIFYLISHEFNRNKRLKCVNIDMVHRHTHSHWMFLHTILFYDFFFMNLSLNVQITKWSKNCAM